MVLDTPAGLHGKLLDAVLRVAERIVIPLQPSLFDIQATHAFVNALREHKRGNDVKIGMVGMRVKENTISNDQLHQFLPKLKAPVLAFFGEKDGFIPLSFVEQLRNEAAKQKKQVEIVVYPGADHGFFCNERASYNAAAAADAWERLKKFLATHLGR